VSIDRQAPCSVSRITITRIFLWIVLYAFICWLHNMATLISWPASNDFRNCSHQRSFTNFIPPFLQQLKRSWAYALSSHFTYCSFASNGHADKMCCVALYFCHSPHLLSVSVFNIYVARNLVLNAWFCAADISLSLSVTHYIVFPFFIKEFPDLAFVRFMPSLFVSFNSIFVFILYTLIFNCWIFI
jgi:hypothetical protein